MTRLPQTCTPPDFDAAVRAINDDNARKTRHDRLPSAQVAFVQTLLNGKPAVDECTARDIFGLYWHQIDSKTTFGARLHATVKAGAIRGLHAIKSNSTSKRYAHRPMAAGLTPPMAVDRPTTANVAAAPS